MKRIRILGLALMVVFVVGAIASSVSSAQVWEARHCEKKAGGKFNENTCGKEGGTKEWEWGPWAELKEPLNVTSTGTLKLTETVFGGLIEVTVTCKGTDKGTVGPGGTDEVTEVTATGCTSSNAKVCSEPVTAVADNLPWNTKLETVEGKIRDKLTTKVGNKKVGYTITCNNGTKEECVAAEATTAMTSEVNGTVVATFDAKTPNATCSAVTSVGKVRGEDINKAAAGTQIRVK